MGQEKFTLAAVDEWLAHDPWGNAKPGDVSQAGGGPREEGGAVRLRAARNGYVSLRVLVRGAGEYQLGVSIGGGLSADLFKVWYHHMHREEGAPAVCWPDALVPVRRSVKHQIPDPDNRIEGQIVQEFWVDVFVPRDAEPGARRGSIKLSAGAEKVVLKLRVEVLEAVLPDEPCVVMDNNSYGSRWLLDMYPSAFGKKPSGSKCWDKTIELLHHYYRVSHEHRTVLHNLGYGHSGKFDPIYGTKVAGAGRDKHLEDWELFDRHYGPLLDGSVFETAAPGAPPPRRPAVPIWGVYTPINPDWPASYLWWGEPGYEVEFTNCLGDFDAHLREKGWTQSRIEFFFNHKKRYRWFEWDGDEQKYAKDNACHAEMIRMWEQATLEGPVNWVYRADASWQMKRQFEELGNHRNFWVCGGFINWYREEARAAAARGETVWWYGGYPPLGAPTSSLLQNLWKTWARGLDGFCHWLATSPGPDPWFDSNGCATGVMYPGERFGIKGPIPSIRLKLLRNGIQDIDLIDAAAKKSGKLEAVREELAAGVPIKLWDKPPKAAVELPPEDWDGHNLSAEHEPIMQAERQLDPGWWGAIRERALAEEVG